MAAVLLPRLTDVSLAADNMSAYAALF